MLILVDCVLTSIVVSGLKMSSQIRTTATIGYVECKLYIRTLESIRKRIGFSSTLCSLEDFVTFNVVTVIFRPESCLSILTTEFVCWVDHQIYIENIAKMMKKVW